MTRLNPSRGCAFHGQQAAPDCQALGRKFGHGHGHGLALLTQAWHGSRTLTLSASC
jgi:hypothetical protein